MSDFNRHIPTRRQYCRFFKFMIFVILFLAMSRLQGQDSKKNFQTEREQLLQYFSSLNDKTHRQITSRDFTSGKCGLGVNAALHNYWNDFTPSQKLEIKKFVLAPLSQKDRIIGKFHIYYDTTGNNEPALLNASYNRISNSAEAYIDSLGKILNDVYHVEIEILGYEAPPFESGETHYRIFVSDMSNYSAGTYGSTNWDENLPPINNDGAAPRYPCYIELHNDFSGFYSKGISAMKVTAAHEFHHVIQIGSYGYRSEDIFFYEITSTWMEDVLYTDVNDYYNYLQDYFGYFSRGLSLNYFDFYHSGYERAIWAHFLAKKFGSNIMLDIWTGMKTLSFFESTIAALTNRNSDFKTAFSEFTYWNYFTADRSDTVKYYPEGNHYPRFLPLLRTTYQSEPDTAGGDVYPLSSSMYEFDLPSDTITAIISNTEVEPAEQKSNTTRRVDILLSAGIPSIPYQEFSNGLTAKLIVTDTSLWHSNYSQGVYRDTIIQQRFAASSNAAPNPFLLAGSKQLLLPIQDNNAKTADVYFYSASLSLAYSKLLPVSIAGPNRVITVQASELRSCLSSGIYFIIAKTKNSEYRWKVAVIR